MNNYILSIKIILESILNIQYIDYTYSKYC